MVPFHPEGSVIESRYRIVRLLGHGSAAATYEAEDLHTGARVALKELAFHGAGSWKNVELFEREVAVLRHLEHPRIPRYLDYFQYEGPQGPILCMVRELVPGCSLAERVSQGWRASEAEARQLAVEILDALRYLHERRPPIIHRDINPRNIICRPDGSWCLIDFGAIQRMLRDPVLGGSTIVGTFGYMAPEQLQGRAVPASDFYGLGTSLLFAMTGQPPADVPQRRLRFDLRTYLDARPELVRWLERMLEPEPARRPESATDALAALQHPRSLWTGRRPRLLALALTATALCGLGIVAVLARTDAPPQEMTVVRLPPVVVTPLQPPAPPEPPAPRYEPACGNRRLNQGEECDGTNFDGHHCRLRGHRGGYLTCTSECRIDASECHDEAHALRLDGGGIQIRWLDVLDSYTLEFWMKPAVFEGQGSGQSIFTGNGITSISPDRGIVPFDILRRSGLGNQKTFPSSDAWYHVAITTDDTERVIYVNGRIVARGGSPGRQTGDLLVARFEGFLDEIRLWRQVRSQQQIRRSMRRALRGDEPYLFGHWPLDEGGGEHVFDHSGNGYNGRIFMSPPKSIIEWTREIALE